MLPKLQFPWLILLLSQWCTNEYFVSKKTHTSKIECILSPCFKLSNCSFLTVTLLLIVFSVFEFLSGIVLNSDYLNSEQTQISQFIDFTILETEMRRDCDMLFFQVCKSRYQTSQVKFWYRIRQCSNLTHDVLHIYSSNELFDTD